MVQSESEDVFPLRLWAALGIAAAFMMIVIIWELTVYTSVHMISVLIMPPMIAAVFSRWKLTLGIGLASMATAAVGIYMNMSHPGTDHDVRQHYVDVALIAVATITGIALSHSRQRRNNELEVATEEASVAQQAILRPIPHRTGSFLAAARYIAPGQGAQIGGDMYEALETDFGVRVILGDARGHGLKTVRLTSTVLGAFRYVAFERQDLSYLAAGLDRSVARNASEEDFVTSLIMQERGGTIDIINAGHPPPLLIRQGATESLETSNIAPPLGLGGSYLSESFRIQPGDRILLYTDGLAEARREGEFFPLYERAAGLIAHGNVTDALASLEFALDQWVQGRFSDDIALMLLEYAPRTDTEGSTASSAD